MYLPGMHQFVVLVDEHFEKILRGIRNEIESGTVFYEKVRDGRDHDPREQLPPSTASVLNQLADIAVVPFFGDDCGGWSRVLEAFQPKLMPLEGDRTLLVGLDTVPMGDLRWLFNTKGPVTLPMDPLFQDEVCDAVIVFNRTGAKKVWQRYLDEKAKNGMQDFLMAGKPSEMMLLRKMYEEGEDWTVFEESPQRLLSYKAHVAATTGPRIGRPLSLEHASIVYFHGRPKLRDLPDSDPVKRGWLHG